jgi:hypothetical protein
MSEDMMTTGAALSALTTAIVYLWRQVQGSAKRCEAKLDQCHESHGEAQDALRVLSVRVGKLEGQLDVISGSD